MSKKKPNKSKKKAIIEEAAHLVNSVRRADGVRVERYSDGSRKYLGSNGDFLWWVRYEEPSVALPPIPCEELRDLEYLCALPAKSLPKGKHADIWILVRKAKSEMTLGSAGREWAKLRKIIDQAALAGDFRSVDEFAKAWTKWREPRPATPISFPQSEGKEPLSLLLAGDCKRNPRRKVSIAVLEAISDIQDDLRRSTPSVERAPTPKEIGAHVSRRSPKGIDDAETSRQLKALGLQGRMSSTVAKTS